MILYYLTENKKIPTEYNILKSTQQGGFRFIKKLGKRLYKEIIYPEIKVFSTLDKVISSSRRARKYAEKAIEAENKLENKNLSPQEKEKLKKEAQKYKKLSYANEKVSSLFNTGSAFGFAGGILASKLLSKLKDYVNNTTD